LQAIGAAGAPRLSRLDEPYQERLAPAQIISIVPSILLLSSGFFSPGTQ
jgi:hypothetical protein